MPGDRHQPPDVAVVEDLLSDHAIEGGEPFAEEQLLRSLTEIRADAVSQRRLRERDWYVDRARDSTKARSQPN
jgi:hypothetical protein